MALRDVNLLLQNDTHYRWSPFLGDVFVVAAVDKKTVRRVADVDLHRLKSTARLFAHEIQMTFHLLSNHYMALTCMLKAKKLKPRILI